jgi:DNA polymerase-3 subunit delta
VDVSPLAEKEARKFLGDMIKNEGYQMNRDALELFYERIENQLSRGMRELPKLFLSGSEEKKITKQMVIDLIPRNLEQNIFELVTQVLNKNTYLAIQIYRDLLLQKEEPIKVNAILLGQFRLLLQVKLLSKNGYQQTDITKVLKVLPYRETCCPTSEAPIRKSPGGCFSGIGRDGIQHEDRARAEGNTI